MDRANSETKRLKEIGLAKLFLWSEAERIQTYPEAFSNLIPNHKYSKRTLASDVFNLIYAQHDKSRPVRSDQIRNLFGMEQVSNEKVVLRGINFIQHVEGNFYQASNEALEIGRVYRDDKESDKWAILLANQIAKYEVRTRLLLYLIGLGGYHMVFSKSDFFTYPSSKTIINNDYNSIPLFEDKSTAFNLLLQEHRHVALGPWWIAEIERFGYEIEESFVFEGVREGPPATNYLNSYIKSSMYLMKYLGIIVQEGNGWCLSAENSVKRLGIPLAEDFVDVYKSFPRRAPIEVLQEIVEEHKDDHGFIIVNHLAHDWATRQDIPAYNSAQEFDEFIRKLLYEDKIKILARHQGQPRHGRGLFGDDQARKIKLVFVQKLNGLGG